MILLLRRNETLKIKFKLNLNALTFGKFFFLIFALYILWFRYAYGTRPIILYGSAILVAFFVFLDILLRRRLIISTVPRIVKTYFVLALYALISGLLVAPNKSHLVSEIITFLAYSVICFSVAYISETEGNLDWAFKIFVLCGIIISAYVYFRGYSYETDGVFAITLGEEQNPNHLAASMIVVLFALLYNFERFQKRVALHSMLVLIFSGVIILSASRKCFAALAVLLFGWIVRFLFAIRKKEISPVSTGSGRFRKEMFAVMILLVGIGVGIVYMLNRFESTAVYEKFLKTISKGNGVGSRLSLYREAWELFKSHPLFGVGFDQFRFFSSSGTYSHSVYAEILSCLGIFGTLIFFVPLLATYFQQMGALLRREFHHPTGFMIGLMFTVELFLGTGTIFLYDFYALFILTALFWLWEHQKASGAVSDCEQQENSRS